MGVFDDERAHRQAQHDYERAREERDREFFAARQRQREIWQEQDRVRQERREQLRREDAEQRAADAKAYALDRQQLWELFVKAVSKPDVAHVVPAPEAVQVESTPVSVRNVVHVRNDALNVVHVRNDAKTTPETSVTSKTSETSKTTLKNVRFTSKTTSESNPAQ